MGRHQWAQSPDPAFQPERSGRFRLLLGRGALFCVVLAVLGWIAISLLLGPRGQGVQPLAEVPLTGIERLPATAVPSPGQQPGQPDATRSEAGATAPASPQPFPAGSGTPNATGPQPATTRLVVHVAGAVRKPGIYKLPPGARAYEAIGAAGGLLKDADASALNLAAMVHDGTQLYVPRRGEARGGEARNPVPGQSPGIGVEATAPGAKINVNTADSTALQTLPGIGPALAGKIITFRSENGPFGSLAELDAVSGIGPVMLARLEPLLGFG